MIMLRLQDRLVQLGISQLVTIVFFGGKTGITNNVPSNSFYAGFPARPHKEWLKQEANLRKIGEFTEKGLK